MKLRTAVAALAALGLSLFASLPATAEQNPYTQASENGSNFNARFPGGKRDWDNIAKFEINPALRTLFSNSYGTSCSAIASPYPYQWCVDATTRTVKMYSQPVGGAAFGWQTAFAINADGTFSQPVPDGSILGRMLGPNAAVQNLGFSPVQSVAGRGGIVTLSAADLADSTAAGRAMLTATNAAGQRTLLYASQAGTTNQFQTGFDVNGLPVFAQPSFANISGTVGASQLPNPGATTLGGVKSATASANQFQTGIDTTGLPLFAQPAFTNLSGSLACSQRPALTGDVTALAASCATTIAPLAVTGGKIAANTITNANIAANTIAGDRVVNSPTIAGYLTADGLVAATPGSANVLMKVTDGPTDAKTWYWNAASSGLALQTLNDASNAGATAFNCTRTGYTPTGCAFSVPLTANSFTGDGSALTAVTSVGTRAPSTIVADSSTDNCTALNSYISAHNDTRLPGGSGFYRSSCTIVVPAGTTLEGEGQVRSDTFGTSGARIVCDATVTPCIQVGTSTSNGTAVLRNIAQSRAGGAPAAGSIGILVLGGFNPKLIDVVSDNNAQCYYFQAQQSSGAGISAFMDRPIASRCSDVYLVQDGWAEIHMTDPRFGVNGTADYTSNTFFRLTCSAAYGTCSGAGGANGLRVQGGQFDQGSNPTHHFMEFVSQTQDGTSDTGDIFITNTHVENVDQALFYSDSTWPNIQRMHIANTLFNTPTTPAFALNAATKLSQWDTVNTKWFVSTFTIPSSVSNNFNRFTMVGGEVSSAAHITGNNGIAQFSLVAWNGVTFDGSWVNLTSMGDGGTITDATTGSATIITPNYVKINGSAGLSCSAGITASTYRSVNGITTHC